MLDKISAIFKHKYSIHIIGMDASGNTKIELSSNVVNRIKIILILLFCIICILFATITYLLLDINTKSMKIQQMQEANSLQQQEITTLSKKISELQNTMDDLDNLAKQLQVGNTVKQASGGQGGPYPEGPTISQLQNSVQQLEYRLGSKEQIASLKKRLSVALYLQQITNNTGSNSNIPSLWPTIGDISSPFGLRWGGSDYHPGIDIASDYNSPIRATADGVVTDAGYNSGGYGNMVDINHGNGYITRYAHASSLSVHVGQNVKRGEVIGYVGSTGFSTGPHLHYEVRVNGKAIDPAGYMIYYN